MVEKRGGSQLDGNEPISTDKRPTDNATERDKGSSLSKYKKVPDLQSSSAGGSKGCSNKENQQIMHPTEIPDHPAPYFKSPAVDFGKLKDAPWENPPAPKVPDIDKAGLANATVEDLVGDFVQEEITSTGVTVLEESMFKQKADRDIADYAEDELLMPMLAKESEKVCWETLEYWIRTYSDDERYKNPKDVDVSTQVAIQAYARGEKPSSKLRFTPWSVLIPHVKKARQGKGLTQNLALLELQKSLVSKVAVDSLRKSASSAMEAEMKSVEEREKLLAPPRRG